MTPKTNPGLDQPVLRFPLVKWQRLRLFIHRCPTEISGFGIVRQSSDDPMLFLVERILILDQRADAHSTTTDENAMHQLLYELTQTGEAQQLRLQWHSHVTMPAYFSGIDLATIERYRSGEWMISLVGNRQNEFEARIDMFRPIHAHREMRVVVEVPADQHLISEVDHEIRRHVRRSGWPSRAVRPDGVVNRIIAASEVETRDER